MSSNAGNHIKKYTCNTKNIKNYSIYIYKPSLFHSHPFAVNLLKFRRQRTPLLWRHLETQRASTCIPLVSWVYSYVCPHRGCCNKMRAADKRRAVHEILHQSYVLLHFLHSVVCQVCFGPRIVTNAHVVRGSEKAIIRLALYRKEMKQSQAHASR